MNRERILKVVLIAVGLLFTAAIYPITMILWQRDQPSYETAMGLSLYFTLGILLLTAVPQPEAHRSLIMFAAWANLAHAGVMAVMVFRDVRARGEWVPVLLFGAIGVALALLAPPKQAVVRAAAKGA